jgi:putative photosynthetic complex assembly protein 2
MTLHGLPVLFALFIWWFSTGLIIFLDNLPIRTFRWSVLGATAVLGISIFGIGATRDDLSVNGAYLAFTFAVLAWGWQEITFYTGTVTGPRTERCKEGCFGWTHFGHAIMASLYHELSILATAAAVIALTWGHGNHVGTWTFVVLWWMHQSAKLNVFLGVRNLNEEFLPEHLDFLRSFLRKKPMNLLFPVSVSVSTIVAVMMFQRAFSGDASEFDAAGYTFVGTLMTLAIAEHWFLVVPLPFAALWNWALLSRGKTLPYDVEVVAGFLGAGKTTYLRRVLSAPSDGRTVVLVNDFGAIGVDGTLLANRGAEVVELPNGCICCSLRGDLARQIGEAVKRWAPTRLLIEPSGVADLAALLAALEHPIIKSQVRRLHVRTIVDAGAFLRDFAVMGDQFETQVRLAPTLVLNKADLASPTELRVLAETLRGINPSGEILLAAYGVVSGGPLAAHQNSHAHHEHAHHEHTRHEHTRHETGQSGVPAIVGGHPHTFDAGFDHDAEFGHAHGGASGHAAPIALGFESWSASLLHACDPDELQRLLESVASGHYGDVARVKGIARAGAGWIRFDLAGGRPSMAAFAPVDGEHPRVVAIGRAVDGVKLQAAFAACAAAAA